VDKGALGRLEGHVHLVLPYCLDNPQTKRWVRDELVHLKCHRRAVRARGTDSPRFDLGREAENRPCRPGRALPLNGGSRPGATSKGMVRAAGVAPNASDGRPDHGEDGVGKHELALAAKSVHISTDPRRHSCLLSGRALACSVK
jgi:hypothetical protein